MENLQRQKEREHFLKHAGLNDYTIEPLAVDASSRRYFRIFLAGGGNRILADDEGCRNKLREFAELSAFLRRYHIHVPEVFAADFDNGFLLLEDLGDSTLTRLLAQNYNEEYLYTLATNALIKIAAITEKPDCCKPLPRQRLLDDICFFVDWYFPMAAGYPLSEEQRRQFVELIENCVDMAYKVPDRMVLWDYHVDNVMLPNSAWHCAVIDFQDAMWGPLTYDIMSLVEDARRDVSAPVAAKMKDLFFKSLSGVSRSDFEESFAFLSMFRHMRVLGRFTILAAINCKDRYLQFVPHLWKMLARTLQHPRLQAVRRWLDTNFPEERRVIPQRKPINQAVVLAAGRGQRMQHLTDNRPKPLVEVGGQALIDYNFDRLKNAGITDVVVNLCYKGEMIKEHLDGKFPDWKIAYSTEKEALETGGGVKKALPLIRGQSFFVCNSDVFFEEEKIKPALWRMMDAWDAQKYDILILLQELDAVCGDRGSGDYRITPDGLPERNTSKADGFPYMFAGISIVNRKIFATVSEARFSLRNLFDAAQTNRRLGFVINHSPFFHIGTPGALEQANLKINGNIKKRC